MDPNVSLKDLLEHAAALQKLLENADPETAVLDAINQDMQQGNTTVMDSLSGLVFGLQDLDEWLRGGGFAPARWKATQQPLVTGPGVAYTRKE